MLPGNIGLLSRVRFPPSGTAPGNVDGPASSTNNALVLFNGTTGKIIKDSADLTYVSPTLSVPDAFVVSSAGSIGLTAGGSNKSITLTPSGTGQLLVPAPSLFSAASGDYNMDVSRVAGSNAGIRFQTALVNRWLIRMNSTAESGSNAGSDFVWNARSDAGGNLGNVFQVTRATGKFSVQPVSGSIAAWGITGALFAVNSSVNTAIITDSTSSGTVASAVAGSLDVPTFAASSVTTFTNAANLYIAGDVAAGTNVTLTNSYGLWNAGKTRLDGAVFLTGKITTYNNVATAGMGMGVVVANPRQAAVTNTTATLATYTVPAADSTYLISANVLVTAATAAAMTVVCTYTDEGNTSRAQTIPFVQLAGTFLTSITNVTGVGPYEGATLQIRCKASTTIVFTTAGTVTGITYNVEGSVLRIA